MIKVENQKVELSILKNGKEIKKYDFKNTLTDVYLDLIIRTQLPTSIGYPLFASVLPSEQILNIFRYAVFMFNDTKPAITTETRLLNEDGINNALLAQKSYISYTDKGRIIKTIYEYQPKQGLTTWNPDNPGEKLQYICFSDELGMQTVPNPTVNFLFSFIDVSNLDIYEADGIAFNVSRYDYIESDEVQITANYNMPHLPRIDNTFLTWRLDTITTCYGINGVGDIQPYSVNDLTFERLSAGVVEISGFNNFSYYDTILYPDDVDAEASLIYTQATIYPSATTYSVATGALYPDDDLFPDNRSKVMSVRFKYISGVSYVETYVNIEDLDVTYDDKELTIKMKCERGAY